MIGHLRASLLLRRTKIVLLQDMVTSDWHNKQCNDGIIFSPFVIIRFRRILLLYHPHGAGQSYETPKHLLQPKVVPTLGLANIFFGWV